MSGAERIAAERQRQVEKEGWSADHDDAHDDGELAIVAALYATPVLLYGRRDHANQVTFIDPFPWEGHDDKRPYRGNVLTENQALPVAKRIRQLEKAGALIAAEIDRLMRKKGTPDGQ